MMSSARRTSGNAHELGSFIKVLLQEGLAHLNDSPAAAMEATLLQRCRQALEGLRPRRRALTRLLQRPPRLQKMAPQACGHQRLSALDNATLALHLAASTAARALLDRADAEWRDLEPAIHGEGAARLPWPPPPGLYAQVVRCTIEYATPDSELRLALMELCTAVAVPQYAALCTRRLIAKGAVLQMPALPAAPVAAPKPVSMPAVVSSSPLADALPGQWFRMVLHQQWTDAQLTWRSRNGGFFMFSSQLAGRAHSLSRLALEGLIQRGHFEKRQPA
jgi:hypothetical protein